MIRAAFFDIDGTLVSLRKKVYPPSAKQALERLRETGVLCYVATGRSKFEIASEHLLDGLYFDGLSKYVITFSAFSAVRCPIEITVFSYPKPPPEATGVSSKVSIWLPSTSIPYRS